MSYAEDQADVAKALHNNPLPGDAARGAMQQAAQDKWARDAKEAQTNPSYDYNRNTRNLNPEQLKHYNEQEVNTTKQADFGGVPNGAAGYHDLQLGHMDDNNVQQKQAQAGADWAQAGFQGNRGNQAGENASQVADYNQSRGNENEALGMMGTAAAGGAPSAAAGQMNLDMNGMMGQRAGAMGAARGLSALGGAQMGGAAADAATGIAGGAGMARSKEIGDAVGAYGGMAGTVRGQDIGRIGQYDQMSQFNADLNNQHRLDMGAIGLNYGNLQNQQAATDMGWEQRAMHPYDVQSDMDQERQEWKAQNEAARVGGSIAKAQATRKSNTDLAYGVGQGVVTAAGTAVGGPVGGAAAGAGYQAATGAIRK